MTDTSHKAVSFQNLGHKAGRITHREKSTRCSWLLKNSTLERLHFRVQSARLRGICGGRITGYKEKGTKQHTEKRRIKTSDAQRTTVSPRRLSRERGTRVSREKALAPQRANHLCVETYRVA